MKKTFKIGEYVIGGIIEVVIDKKIITINFRDMFGGTNKVLDTKSFAITDRNIERDILFYISDNGTSYYADKVLEYIKTKVEILRLYFKVEIPKLTQFGW